MRAAAWPRSSRREERLLVAGDTLAIHPVSRLPELLSEGDVLVVNDAATLPAALLGRTAEGEAVELRLASWSSDRRWWAVAFGGGGWRARTEERPPAPPVPIGETLRFGALGVRVVGRSPHSARLWEVELEAGGEELWTLLYRAGRPVQYSHLVGELALWDVQNVYGGRPWAVEQPSAGRALTGETLLKLLRRGIEVVPLTHATGLSSTGDPELDRHLPLPERFEIPPQTTAALRRARRVIAVGTSVTRALETQTAGAGVATLRLGPTTRLAVVDGLLTGIHDPTASHYELLQAFAPRATLEAAYRAAEAGGFLAHEFGDFMLLWRRPAAAPPR